MISFVLDLGTMFCFSHGYKFQNGVESKSNEFQPLPSHLGILLLHSILHVMTKDHFDKPCKELPRCVALKHKGQEGQGGERESISGKRERERGVNELSEEGHQRWRCRNGEGERESV